MSTTHVTILLEISQQDQIDGHIHSCFRCPVAIALRRMVKPRTSVHVSPDVIIFSGWMRIYRIIPSDELAAFMMDYDRGKTDGKGCEFEIPNFPRAILLPEFRP